MRRAVYQWPSSRPLSGRLSPTTIDRKEPPLKLRNLVLLGAGIGIGYALSQKIHEDDPEVVHGPQRTQPSSMPGLAAASTQAQKLADQASVRSLDAIRKARDAIRARLADYDQEDDAAWN